MGGIVLLIILLALFMYSWMQSAKSELKQYNKLHKKNFKTWIEVREHKDALLEKELERDQKKALREEKLKQNKNQKEERKSMRKEKATPSEFYSSDMGSRLKKLRQMYKDGILSKTEFEKAKNKLLK